MGAEGDVAKTTEWFFRLHGHGKEFLTRNEVLILSESLLFSTCL